MPVARSSACEVAWHKRGTGSGVGMRSNARVSEFPVGSIEGLLVSAIGRLLMGRAGSGTSTAMLLAFRTAPYAAVRTLTLPHRTDTIVRFCDMLSPLKFQGGYIPNALVLCALKLGYACKYSHSLPAFSITESANVSGSKSNANFYAQELSVSIYVQDTILFVTNTLFSCYW